MFHSRKLNSTINRLLTIKRKQYDKKTLAISYSDNISCFNELLQVDNSVSLDPRNIQVLATEL